MGHYLSEMGGRMTHAEETRMNYLAKQRAEKILKETPFKITDFKKGDNVIVRKDIDSSDLTSYYGWWDLLILFIAGPIGCRNCIPFKIESVNEKEGKLKIYVGKIINQGPIFELDYLPFEPVKK